MDDTWYNQPGNRIAALVSTLEPTILLDLDCYEETARLDSDIKFGSWSFASLPIFEPQNEHQFTARCDLRLRFKGDPLIDDV
jgi:hypothetical protein